MRRMCSHGARFVLFVAALAGCGGEQGDTDNDGSATGGDASASGPTSDGPNGDAEPAAMAGITQLHNDARAAVDPPAASPIPPLLWSAEVAGVAQAHADKCVFEHSGGAYGENLYASTGDSKPADVVNSWVSEVADYDYASNGCSGVCGHYTQVVWANSQRLGCGVAKCSENSPFGGAAWEIWVCNYDPPGNWVGEKPY